MANESISAIRFSTASFTTTALGKNDPAVGDFCEEGGRRFVFVYNEGGASAAVGCGLVLNSAASGYSVTVSSVTSADFLVGVVQFATLTTGAYAWAMVRGVGYVKMMATSGTVAARQNLELGGNGLFYGISNTTGNGPCVGQAVSAIVSSATGLAFVSCFG